ncbi:McrB family protein [Pseudomonas arsenicoxydans]|uniref:DNA methyltransferase n=1 Tax=Pseudomonas arsenicoxydans TaxID=702115 RepID=A0A4P6G411_9PSED|nr:DNA methyltransferase [Pseudomonas arsenicoxydans]QAY84090.1 DNA methyltransferase [Pseudomonas arsenicoxydans]
MSKYLTAARIKAGIAALEDTRAKGSLLEFLLLKRTLAIKGEVSAPLTLGEQAFSRALTELAAVHDQIDMKGQRQVFNVFASDDSKGGFRAGKYVSNGPGSTVISNPWQTIVEFSGTKPRKVGFKASYLDNLEKPLLKAASEDKPKLPEVAVWNYRRTDIESILGAEADPAKRAGLLRAHFESDYNLSTQEIATLFDAAGNLGIADTDLQDQPAAPEEYLNLEGVTKPSATDPVGMPCSLDLVAALAAKPFVILTGASGTGKSRSTLRLAEQLQEMYEGQVDGNIFQLVPVGPDWTSPKRLIGFRTPFGQSRQTADGKDTNESYEITDTLRIILRACNPASTAIPHFLLFDEMNLSHVERYFAPFLSLMEASSIVEDSDNAAIIDSRSLQVISELLNLEDPDSAEAKSAKLLVSNEQPLRLPPNLFYLGTVNIDETTYMFSPKVLDRAHVLEVKALRPSEYVAGVPQEEEIDLALANQLLREAIDDRDAGEGRTSDPSKIVDSLVAKHGVEQADLDAAKQFTLRTLEGCFKLLSPVGFEFAFRINKEVYAYLYVWIKAQIAKGAIPSDAMKRWTDGLDRALFQKVLPKIHGNRSALGDSLKALHSFLGGAHADAVPPAKYTLGAEAATRIEHADAIAIPMGSEFKLCRAKLAEMHGRLLSRNYVSFVK